MLLLYSAKFMRICYEKYASARSEYGYGEDDADSDEEGNARRITEVSSHWAVLCMSWLTNAIEQKAKPCSKQSILTTFESDAANATVSAAHVKGSEIRKIRFQMVVHCFRVCVGLRWFPQSFRKTQLSRKTQICARAETRFSRYVCSNVVFCFSRFQ